MKTFFRIALAIAVAVLLSVGAMWWISTVQEESRRNDLLFFLQRVRAVESAEARPVRLRATDLPGKPISVCTIWDYERVDELRTFLGQQRFEQLMGSYRMNDRKGGIVAVHEKFIVVADPVQTARTACSAADKALLILTGRSFDLQGP